MSKKDTAESKKILKLLGKPTTTTRITKNNNPAIQKLIHYFEGDMQQVYRWYDTLKSLGWVDSDYMEFLKSVKANKKKLEKPEFDNVIYTFHFYEPIIFTHQKAYWVKNMDMETF